MVQATGEERAVHLAREAVELVDAGHREVGISWNTPQWKLAELLTLSSFNRLLPGI